MYKLLVLTAVLVSVAFTAKVNAQGTNRARAPHTLTHPLTQSQQQAIRVFLDGNPQLRQAVPRDAHATDMDGYKPIAYVLEGQFNQDSFDDLAVVFTSKSGQPLNPRDPLGQTNRDWVIVIFHGSAGGTYTSQTIHRENGSCFDGLYYDSPKKQVLWGCGLYTGSFHFGDGRYQVRPSDGENEVVIPEKTPQHLMRRRTPVSNDSSPIRMVNFKNFTYRVDRQAVRLRNGKYEKRFREPGDSMDQVIETTLVTVEYGDLTGDGVDEAVIYVVQAGPGNSFADYGFVYTMRNAVVALLTEFPGGGKFEYPVFGAHVEGGTLVVDHGEDPPNYNGSPCCPAFYRSWIYRWNGSRLIELTRSSLVRKL